MSRSRSTTTTTSTSLGLDTPSLPRPAPVPTSHQFQSQLAREILDRNMLLQPPTPSLPSALTLTTRSARVQRQLRFEPDGVITQIDEQCYWFGPCETRTRSATGDSEVVVETRRGHGAGLRDVFVTGTNTNSRGRTRGSGQTSSRIEEVDKTPLPSRDASRGGARPTSNNTIRRDTPARNDSRSEGRLAEDMEGLCARMSVLNARLDEWSRRLAADGGGSENGEDREGDGDGDGDVYDTATREEEEEMRYAEGLGRAERSRR